MKVKTSDLTQIIAQASCLSERLGKQLQVTDSEQQLTSRLHRGCELSAHGNWEKFQKRLLWDGLDVEQVQQALRSLPASSGSRRTDISPFAMFYHRHCR